jgi:glycosyltransferase involved in cell wall biosynthesis
MKKVAIITAFDPFTFRGGIETYTRQLIELLESHNIQTDVYHSGLIEEVHDFHNDYLGKLYLSGKQIVGCDRQYDFIIANAFYGFSYFPTRIKTFNIYHLTHKGFADKIKHVVPSHQYLEWKFLWGELTESVSGFNRRKIAVSDSVKDELQRYYRFDDVQAVPHGIDTHIFQKSDKSMSRKRWDIPDGAFVGLYVGRWDALKGCDVLEKVILLTPYIYWIVVLGTGSDQYVIPMRENIRIIEQLEHEQLSAIYSASDFMLFPSRYEGFGYVVAEAMACELPVITTNVGIVQTVYREEPLRTLLLTEAPSDQEAFLSKCIEKIDMVRRNATLRNEICRASRRVIEKSFAVEHWRTAMSYALGVSSR